ncbi:MAG: DUF4293 family protein [Candidatus Cryptobacteroides sp.]|jgi:hypothetical protein|nr:DUF4293 family protein [Bacteroidales bacterium]MDY2935418.1 DUF4293 family protein [Candidatus Cryptobacteroides sp.]MDY6319768.1 DUF4293 family protein [Bacteroidales bacterium]MDY6377836.1 DUF4293 family protein [Bacteroidales bacterium]MDY6384212.1 DUF4293 family protein [Bacteroidales bacterium]
MWQRIQTLYLAIATGLIVAMFFCVRCYVLGPGGTRAEELKFAQFVPYLVLLIVIGLLQLIALTVYSHRIFQMRTAVLSAILMIALQLWIAVEFFTSGDEFIFTVPNIFPLLAAILNFLAARNIFKDEMMVKNSSRLR